MVNKEENRAEKKTIHSWGHLHLKSDLAKWTILKLKTDVHYVSSTVNGNRDGGSYVYDSDSISHTYPKARLTELVILWQSLELMKANINPILPPCFGEAALSSNCGEKLANNIQSTVANVIIRVCLWNLTGLACCTVNILSLYLFCFNRCQHSL